MTQLIVSLASVSRIGANRRASQPRDCTCQGVLRRIQHGRRNRSDAGFAAPLHDSIHAGFSVMVRTP